MSLISIRTNLSANQLPDNFGPEFAKELSKISGIAEHYFCWSIETDISMSLVNTLLNY